MRAPICAAKLRSTVVFLMAGCTLNDVFCLREKWRECSTGKTTEGTREETTQELYRRRKGRHFEAALGKNFMRANLAFSRWQDPCNLQDLEIAGFQGNDNPA
jgi:hypothetical protein